jgi:hypothetical protein
MTRRAALPFLLAAAGSAVVTSASSFIHPGVLVSSSQLAYIKNAINDGIEPIASSYTKALSSSFSRLSYKPFGPPAGGWIACGAFSHPDYGCTNESVDSANAYLQALLFAVNGTQAYADNAITILNLYGRGLMGYNESYENAPLQAGWSAQKWTRAAELLAHTPGSGWLPADQAAFAAMLYRATLPRIFDGNCSNGNWELTMIEALLGIGVFTENATVFQQGLDLWRSRVPAYFWVPQDGPKPLKPSDCPEPWWYVQEVFNASTSGICQETCRDLGHMQFGLSSAINAAETAWVQGVDLYAEQADRLAAALEFHAYYLLGNPVPSYLCNGTGLKVSQAPTFEIAHTALAIRGAGNGTALFSLPYTLAHLMTQVRTMADPSMMFMMIYETLTHGGVPPSEQQRGQQQEGGQGST